MEEEAGEVAVEPPLLCAAVERAQAVLGVRLDEVRRGCEERQAVVHLVGALTVELVLPPGVWEGLTNPSHHASAAVERQDRPLQPGTHSFVPLWGPQ